MSVQAPTSIDDAFRKRFARSAELYERSRKAIAGGITHDSRNFVPFPIYIERADGSRKWDVDGNELIDHWMGHGALLLGHNHPQVTAAVAEQVPAVIVEPGGGSNGIIPTSVQFLRDLRALTSQRGVVLIFDEVITGFRYSPGGAQQVYGVTPDVTTLAKIVAGGLPGGAVVGKRDIMQVQTFKGELHRDRFERVLQQGTFNANPLSAAAGLNALQIVAEGWPTEQANEAGEQLRTGLRDTFERSHVAGGVLGEASVFQILLGEGMQEAVDTTDVQRLMAGRGAVNTLRKAMLLNGIDLMRSGGFTSIVHQDEELSKTIAAFDRALEALQREGLA